LLYKHINEKPSPYPERTQTLNPTPETLLTPKQDKKSADKKSAEDKRAAETKAAVVPFFFFFITPKPRVE